LWTWLRGRHSLYPIGLVVVLALSFAPSLAQLQQRDIEGMEWDAMVELVQMLPERAIIVVPPNGDKTREAFPSTLARRFDKSIVVLPALPDGSVPPLVLKSNRGVYYYRSISCGIEESHAPDCETALTGLDTVREWTLDEGERRGEGYYRFPYSNPSRIGLYRID